MDLFVSSISPLSPETTQPALSSVLNTTTQEHRIQHCSQAGPGKGAKGPRRGVAPGMLQTVTPDAAGLLPPGKHPIHQNSCSTKKLLRLFSPTNLPRDGYRGAPSLHLLFNEWRAF